MANKFRNEKMLHIGGVEILLRPTFENCANLESALNMSLSQLTYNLAMKKLPTMTDLAKVIYFCQADKKLKMEEVWDLVMAQGVGLTTQILEFIASITSGDQTQVEVSPELVKKN